MRSVRGFVMLITAAVAAGCLQVDVADGVLKCSSDPKRPCPEGYYCSTDNTCWKKPPVKHRGQACKLPVECDTGHCIDGVCCDSACLGQCQACDVGAGGVCTTISGAPRKNRPSCGLAGFACTGVCDGHDATACTYPDASTSCGAQVCYGPPPTLQSATVCDGLGHCVAVGGGMLATPCPAPTGGTPVCAGDQCDFVCDPPYQRVGATCVVPDMG